MNASHDDDPRITDYVLGEMDAQQRRLFEQELASDPELAAAVREAEQLTGQLQTLYADESRRALPADQREKILEAAAFAPRHDGPSTPLPPRDSVADAPGSGLAWPQLALLVVPLVAVVVILLLAAQRQAATLAQQTPDAQPTPDTLGPAIAASDETSSPDADALDSLSVVAAQPISGSGAADDQGGAGKTVRLDQGRLKALADNKQKGKPVQSRGALASPANTPQGAMESSNALEGAYGSGPAEPEQLRRLSGIEPRFGRPQSGQAQDQTLDTHLSKAVAEEEEMAEGFGMGDMDMGYSMGMGMGMGGMGGMGRPGDGMATDELHMGYGMEVQRDSSLATIPNPASVVAERLLGEGTGPGQAGNRYDAITDNPFRRVREHPLSTFSIDVDTASYSKVRNYLRGNQLPRPDAVRIEELVNYFHYDYRGPEDDPDVDDDAPTGETAEAATDGAAPFNADVEIAACPWTPQNRLVRVGIKGREVANEDRPASNLVFLLDVSGSMNQPNKLPLVKQGMQMLLEQLSEDDRVAIVVYASATGLVLDSTPADQHATIFGALERLSAGGSTNGGDGIRLAYQVARDHFIEGGVNRVLLCTDGDFNIGTTGTDELVRLVEQESKGGIFVSVMGFGMDNHNDSMLEQISNKGNGNYAFIDSAAEAHKVFVEQTNGTLMTIAKDVKIQVEFNPAEVAAYRLIGYENRILAKEDFNDDTKDAGEIGAGHTVTALYEIVPAGEQAEPIAPTVDPLRYQTPASTTEQAESGEMLTVKLRYKQPDGEVSKLLQFPVEDAGKPFAAASDDMQFASAVAGFGMQLRNSPYKGQWTLAAVAETARSASGEDPHGLRAEFVELVETAAKLRGENGE